MHILRRLILGMLIGLVIAGLASAMLGLASDSITGAGLDGTAGVLMASLLLGLAYALLFQPTQSGHAENLMCGLVMGIIAWMIVAMNLGPVLGGGGPLWEAAAARDLLPWLILYAIIGSGVGLGYGLIYIGWGERLRLTEPEAPAAVPAVTTRVVIVGGGYAGVSAAQALEEAVKDDLTVDICLISQHNYLLHTPMLSEVSASAVNPQNISPPLRSFFRRVQVVQGAVERVDLAERVVYLASDSRSPYQKLNFDHLVLTVGSVPNFFGNDAVATEAFTFKSLEDAVLLRNQIIDLFERADIEEDPDKRRCLLTFVVTGGGFAGVELIGGMNDFARGMLAYYPNIPPEDLRFILVHSGHTILPELSDSLSKYAQGKLEERGVEFRLGQRVTGATARAAIMGDEVIPTETLVWTAGNRSNPILESLGLPLTRRGQLEVNAELAVPDVPGLWAAGDCAQIPDLSTGGSAPATAQHAVRQGKVLGQNVAASIKEKPLKTFQYKTIGSLAVLGHQLAVAEIMGHRFSGFLAWLMWRVIYLAKLPTMEKQVRVGLDWLVDIFFPPDIVQTIDFNRPDPADRLEERQPFIGERKVERELVYEN